MNLHDRGLDVVTPLRLALACMMRSKASGRNSTPVTVNGRMWPRGAYASTARSQIVDFHLSLPRFGMIDRRAFLLGREYGLLDRDDDIEPFSGIQSIASSQARLLRARSDAHERMLAELFVGEVAFGAAGEPRGDMSQGRASSAS